MTITNLFKVIFLFFISNTLFAGLGIGEKAPYFELTTKDNTLFKLSDVKGKLTLIDFWASYCEPCRINNEDLNDTYSNYKDLGFEIVSVSADKDTAAWLRAIEKDALQWKTQLLDYDGKFVGKKYKVELLPSSYLIDQNGIILAVDQSSYDLDKFLAKYYKENIIAYPSITADSIYFLTKTKYQLLNAEESSVKKGNDSYINLEDLPVGKYTLKVGSALKSIEKIESHPEEGRLTFKNHNRIIHFSHHVPFQIYNQYGHLMLEGKEKSIPIVDFPSGAYIIVLNGHIRRFHFTNQAGL